MTTRPTGNRVLQLAACMLAMGAVANLQYSWTLFTTPLMEHLGVKLSVVQLAFSLFVIAQTWLVPIEGYFIDRFGARWIVTIGGVLVGLGWIGSGYAATVGQLLFLVLARRRRRGRRLRRGDRDGPEVVSGSARSGRGPGRRLLRLRHGAHRHSDSADDREPRVPGRVHLLGHRPGRRGDRSPRNCWRSRPRAGRRRAAASRSPSRSPSRRCRPTTRHGRWSGRGRSG